MVKDLLICFLVRTKKLKFFEAKLKNENIEYSKEKNDNWYNFRFNEKNIEIIKYYILYFKLVIQNEHFFIDNHNFKDNEYSDVPTFDLIIIDEIESIH